MMTAPAAWLVVVVGALVGVLVGLTGTSGAFIIPTLVYVFGLTQLRAQGTSLFIALIPLWIAPLWSYARAGNVNWRLGATLAIGLAMGAFVGGRFAQHLPQTLLRRGFAVVLLIMAARMMLQK
ncbi:sulfite exporter TauE/SafE family protein [Terriglobus aquaticus]|uniref:Probable membrane transporter protein n=1 Tax=Terriglobus aquaticus TaxID=940139 RepID=A0ABW9KJW4_9BACT|nr:sulfite exporter TauE/SafE family protein [Terriglobus aquaticus]